MTQGATTYAIVLADTAGLIRHWNGGAEQLFGYSAAEAQGQSLDLIVPEEYRERHWGGFRRTMRTGVCKLDRAVTNLPVKCRDGSVRVFPARFVFLQDARNRAVGAMGIYSMPDGSEKPFGVGLCHNDAFVAGDLGSFASAALPRNRAMGNEVSNPEHQHGRGRSSRRFDARDRALVRVQSAASVVRDGGRASELAARSPSSARGDLSGYCDWNRVGEPGNGAP